MSTASIELVDRLFPLRLRHSTRLKHSHGLPADRRQGTGSSSATHALPVRPGRATPRRPPCPLYSWPPRCTARPPGGTPAGYARGFAASVHRSPPPHHDRAIHLRRARDHILDVVRVAGAIYVGVVMPLGGLILHVRHRDRDTAELFLPARCRWNRNCWNLFLGVVLGQHFGDRRRQGGLAVIDVPDRVPIFTCGLLRSNFSFAISFLPVRN